MVFMQFRTFVSYWYLHYILNTSMWMLEPKERKVCNTVLVLVLAGVLYSCYHFLPGHALMLMHFTQWLLGIEQGPLMPEEAEAAIAVDS